MSSRPSWMAASFLHCFQSACRRIPGGVWDSFRKRLETLGYLQWHFRTKGEAPGEPILRAFHNIRRADAVLTWDGWPVPKIVEGEETYPNARRPEWPEAEYIVGNPPFMGNKRLRQALGEGYVDALFRANPRTRHSADMVMYWWDIAAELLGRGKPTLRRFGFVTTNSITQEFNRRVLQRHLNGKHRLSLVLAIPDHPWTKATSDAAAVRIAMTVVARGTFEGLLRSVVSEKDLNTDEPVIEFADRFGRISAHLSVGVVVTLAVSLRSNDGLCQQGVKLIGDGFLLTPEEAVSGYSNEMAVVKGAESGATRTPIPAQGGQQSGDFGQQVMAA